MKRKNRKQSAGSVATEVFVRGFVATALLSALQDRTGNTAATDWRKVFRHGLQGGAALTAGTIAAEAVIRRDYGTGATAVLAGAVAVVAAETAFNTPRIQESFIGQEEA